MYLQKRVSGGEYRGLPAPPNHHYRARISFWKWGRAFGDTFTPNNALCSSLQDHLYLSFCHHWAFPFLHLLLSYIFLSHSSAFLSSSSIPVLPTLCPLNQTETSPPSLCWWVICRKIKVNGGFPQHKNIPALWFHVHFPPIPGALLPTSTARLEGCESGTIYSWSRGKAPKCRLGNRKMLPALTMQIKPFLNVL